VLLIAIIRRLLQAQADDPEWCDAAVEEQLSVSLKDVGVTENYSRDEHAEGNNSGGEVEVC